MSLIKTFTKSVDIIEGPLLQMFPTPKVLDRSNAIQDEKVISLVANEKWRLKLTLSNSGSLIDFSAPASLATTEMRVSAFNNADTAEVVLANSLVSGESDLPNGVLCFECPVDTLLPFWANDFDYNPWGTLVISVYVKDSDGNDFLIYDRVNILDDEFGGTGSVSPNSKSYLQTADVKPRALNAATYSAPTTDADLAQKGYVDARETAVQGNLDTHVANTANPHSVTAAQVGKDTEQWNADRIRTVNVDLTGIVSGNVLSYNGTSFVPGSASGLPAGTAGDILYHNGSGWVVLNPGSNGQLLKSNGALLAPSWDSVSGTGDIVGPASSTDDVVAVYDGTTGKLLKDSSVVVGEIVKRADIIATGTDVVQLGVKASASHTANIFEAQDSGSTVLAAIDKDGVITSPNIKAGTVAIGGLDIDWSLKEAYRTKAIATNETFTFSNVTNGTTIVLDITSSSGAVLTLPGSVTVLNGGSFTPDARNIITITANDGATEQFATFATA